MKSASEENVGFLKNVWNSVRQNSSNSLFGSQHPSATIKHHKKSQSPKPDYLSASDCDPTPRSPHKNFGLHDKTCNLEISRDTEVFKEVRRNENLHKLTHNNRNKSVVLEEFVTEDNLPPRHELLNNIEVLKLRVEHSKTELAKKDAEIAHLKRKLKEYKTIAKGLDNMDAESLSLVIENSRLAANLSRLSDLLTSNSPSSILSLLYPPHNSAFIEFPKTPSIQASAAHNTPSTSKYNVLNNSQDYYTSGKENNRNTPHSSHCTGGTRSPTPNRKSSLAKAPKLQRPCCPTIITPQHTSYAPDDRCVSKPQTAKNNRELQSSTTAGGSGGLVFDFDELIRWIPKQVNSALGQLGRELNISSDGMDTLKEFMVGINKAYLQREKETMTQVVKMCQKEVKTIKRGYVDQPITMKSSQSSQRRHKSDKAAFMEGANWILTKVQTDFGRVRHSMNSVINDLTASPQIIVKALRFATEGVDKIARKLEKYEAQVSEQILQEINLNKPKNIAVRIEPQTPSEFGIPEAERLCSDDEMEADSLSDSL